MLQVTPFWDAARGLVTRATAKTAELVARAGYEDKARALARWGMLVGGLSVVLEHIGDDPTPEELRALFWLLGRELEQIGEPIAAVWFALAEEQGAFDLETLKEQAAAAMEDARDLVSADHMAPVWGLLDRLTTTGKKDQ